MSLYTVQDPGQERAGRGEDRASVPGQSAESVALSWIGQLLARDPLARDQFAEARHDAALAEQAAGRAAQARHQAATATARATAEVRKAGTRHTISRPAGTTLAALLAALDAIPAYWSAQAFGLTQDSTLTITALLCAALGGAMWLLDLFTRQHRRAALRALQASLAAGFTALFVLRLDYLQTTGGTGLWLAAIQAVALTALSAALVAVGYVILAHRVRPEVAAARRAARHAASSDAEQAAAEAAATARASRAALEDTTIAAALAEPPTGISHDQFLHALDDALDTLLHRQATTR